MTTINGLIAILQEEAEENGGNSQIAFQYFTKSMADEHFHLGDITTEVWKWMCNKYDNSGLPDQWSEEFWACY
jgi:hypothetical protein